MRRLALTLVLLAALVAPMATAQDREDPRAPGLGTRIEKVIRSIVKRIIPVPNDELSPPKP